MRRRPHVFVLAVPWLWLGIFVLAPVAIMLRIALSQAREGIPPYERLLRWTGWQPHPEATWDNFALVLGDPLYRDAFALSLKVAGVSTLICLLVGYPMALAIARAPERRRNALLLALMLPFWTGFLMRINAWIGLLQDDGWINTTLAWIGVHPVRLLYTNAAVLIGIVYTYLPFMVLPLYARLTRLDQTLREAAADLGAPPWGVFLSVTLPLSLPGILAGVLLVFIPAVGEYVIPELLGGPQAQLIGRVLWQEFFDNRDWPTAAALSCTLLALLLLLPAALLSAIRRRADDRA